MKHLYTGLFSLLLLSATTAAFSQSSIVYQADPTPGVVFGTPFSGTADGSSAFSGDGITLAGTERIITEIGVAIFQRNMTNFVPTEITVRLYTDCPSTPDDGSCGSEGAGQLIEGSEVTIPIQGEPAVGNLFTIRMPNVDVSSEEDSTIWVMFNVPTNDILGVVNGVAITGSDAPNEINAISRCSTSDDSDGCAEIVAGAASNNFAMTIRATEALSINDVTLEQAISIFPNPLGNEATVAFQDSVNPTQAKIYDINGRQVAQKYTYNLENNFKMDTSNLASGTYFLHFEAEEGLAVKQLIKI